MTSLFDRVESERAQPEEIGRHSTREERRRALADLPLAFFRHSPEGPHHHLVGAKAVRR